MIAANELRKGVTFQLDEDIFKVIDYHHNKTGRGLANIRVKARNLRSGAILEKTFSSSERVQDIRLDYHQVQFLYKDGDAFVFMDNETYEQPAVSAALLGDAAPYLKEGLNVKLTFYEGEPLDIDLPTSVELQVTEADTALRGDTATGVNKRIITETGLEVQVPAFVAVGDVIKVDTRSGEYITRV
ncbi:MAG: elongation factor P [Chloroflexi bacterium]|nr:elongation factor P [Chloroflexota bacterium]